MKKKLLCAALAGMLTIASLTGCGGKETASGGKNGEKVRIRLTYGITEIDGQNNDLDVIFAEF